MALFYSMRYTLELDSPKSGQRKTVKFTGIIDVRFLFFELFTLFLPSEE